MAAHHEMRNWKMDWMSFCVWRPATTDKQTNERTSRRAFTRSEVVLIIYCYYYQHCCGMLMRVRAVMRPHFTHVSQRERCSDDINDARFAFEHSQFHRDRHKRSARSQLQSNRRRHKNNAHYLWVCNFFPILLGVRLFCTLFFFWRERSRARVIACVLACARECNSFPFWCIIAFNGPFVAIALPPPPPFFSGPRCQPAAFLLLFSILRIYFYLLWFSIMIMVCHHALDSGMGGRVRNEKVIFAWVCAAHVEADIIP